MSLPLSRKRWAFSLAFAVLLATACLAQAADDPLMGLQAVQEPLPWFDAERNYAAWGGRAAGLAPNQTVAVTSRGRPPMDAPMSLRLSRFLYPAEDGHLDALVRFDMDLGQTPDGRILMSLVDADGRTASRTEVSPIPGSQLHFSYRVPPEMAGRSGELRLTWERPEGAAHASAPFKVSPPAGAERSGRVRLTVPNTSAVSLASAPMTVGVPFPQGALDSTDNLRLLDEEGREIPLQIMETARWARFGGVKWALCDFRLDLDGGAREVFLEYGPDVRRAQRPELAVDEAAEGFPAIEAGRVRLGEGGVSFDARGDGNFADVLGAGALSGAFVESTERIHARYGRTSRGTIYAMPAAQQYAIEESGPEKVVLRAEGWFENEETGGRFCKFVNRYVVHRDSPVVRIFHTWIFTGDGNRDNIRSMGWRFPTEGLNPAGFLTSFAGDGEWREGHYLRQHEHDEYALFERASFRPHGRVPAEWEMEPWRPINEIGTGRRAAGAMAASGPAARAYVGVQDFWQNFPASLMLEEDAMTFYQWPRYGRMPQHPLDPEDIGNVWRLWFAHEGESLSFRLPREIAEGPIYQDEARGEPHFAYARPESVNAQGVAKTAEMWLYLTPPDASPGDAAKVLRGLHEESLRAVVDPEWMAASGAFYEISAADSEQYPDLERAYDDNVRTPILYAERMGVYGKWIYGDILRTANLDAQTSGLYRTFRKAHWGWPFSWTPFARSGDLEFLRFAQAATRMMSDTHFCHYVSDDVAEQFANLPEHRMWAVLQPFRRVGWHNRNLLPWAGYWGTSTRCYVDQADYLWDAWHVTGYRRAKDVALAWAEQTKIEEADKIMRGPITAARNRGRWPANLQKQYLEMYENTWDPWFLAATQAIADMNLWRYREEGYEGHFWHAGNLYWQRYSRCPEHMEYIQAHIERWSDWQYLGWASSPSTTIPAATFGHLLTGDESLAHRAAGMADLMRWAIFTGDEPWWYRGFYARGPMGAHLILTSWSQKWFPMVLETFNRAGGEPERFIPFAFTQPLNADTRIAVKKEAGEPLLIRTAGRHSIAGPDGQVHLEGEEDEVVLDADAPAGVYTLNLGRRRVRLPLTPPHTPEVLIPGTDRTVPGGNRLGLAQHWFHVPDGTESFEIVFQNVSYFRHSLRQVVVWDPDGNEAWAHRERAVDYDPEVETLNASIQVAPGQSGRMWRLTMPEAVAMPFRLSENLPKALSHDPWRWFEPGQ